ncbi:MAG: hypothetical protein JW828_07265 [Sedimentisphaerales bacterium]|nr:hypothetical protein [Sedimentisphaerales bacterium]
MDGLQQARDLTTQPKNDIMHRASSLVLLHALMPLAWIILGGLVVAPRVVPVYHNIPARLPLMSEWIMDLSTRIPQQWIIILPSLAVLLFLDAGVYWLLSRVFRGAVAAWWSGSITFAQAAFTFFCLVALYLPIHIGMQIPPCGGFDSHAH